MSEMTIRERLAAAIHGQETDRLPFAPKVFAGSYLKLQDARFQQMPGAALAAWLECDRWMVIGTGVAVSRPGVRVESRREGARLTTRYETPEGALTYVQGFEPGSETWHPVEYPIKTPADLKAARHVFAATEYRVDAAALEAARQRLAATGDEALLVAGHGPSPLMDLIQHWAGPENTLYWLHDYPEPMDELIAVMQQDHLRHLRLLAQTTPTDYVMSTENTSTTLLSPRLFRRYPLRHLSEYGEIIQAQGKHHLLHQCGKLKALLPDIATIPAVSIEAYSSPPVGDTTWADAVRLCPGKSVMGGTCASLWLRPAGEIVDTILADIAAAATTRGLILTSGGVMPPAAGPEKIRDVWRGVRAGL